MKREKIRKRKRKGQDSGRNGSTSTGKRGKMEWVRQGGMGCYLKLENLLFLLLGCKVPQWKIMCCFVNQLLQFLVSEYFSMLLNFKGLPKEEFVKKNPTRFWSYSVGRSGTIFAGCGLVMFQAEILLLIICSGVGKRESWKRDRSRPQPGK